MQKEEKQLLLKRGAAAIWRQVRSFRREIIILTTFGLISAAANGSVPYITGRFFDALIEVSQGNISGSGIPLWATLLALWAVIQLVANNIDWVIDRTRRSVDSQLQLRIQEVGFTHLLRLPIGFHKKERINEILDRFSQAGWRITSVFRTLTEFAPQFLSIIVGIVLAYTIQPFLAGVLLIGVALYVVLLVILLRPAASRDREVFKRWNEAWGNAASVVQQVESVKQAASEAYEEKKIHKNLFQDVVRHWRALQYLWSNVSFFQRALVFFTQLAIFIFSVRLVSEGSITVGDLIALNGYAQMFFGPFVTLGHSWETLQNGFNSAAKIDEVLDVPVEVYHPKEAVAPEDVSGSVKFENASFFYEDKSVPVLKGISFDVPAGGIVAFVGESGVGKSTAISLISGYFFPTEGAVRVNGVDTRQYDLIKLRSQIAVVPQEVALFNDTIGENIRYGTFSASDRDIRRAAKEAHIDEFIDGLPEKYDTVVGERGIKLSVGQKQRVAIARAILRDPSILILDEPTSALDAKTEQYITESLEKLMQGRTTFIIAHRLSTVRRADKILVFEKGQIVEEGKHDDLIKIEDGVYRRLYEYQIGLHQ